MLVWMTLVDGILALVSVLPLAVLAGALFLWAARKDGAEDDAVQARLQIRRRTRLGPD